MSYFWLDDKGEFFSVYVSLESIQYAKENGIHMLSFPPHCSHRLQPLDRSVFFSLKRHYNVQCNAWLNSHPGRPMQPLDIPAICCNAFKLTMSPASIQSGFESTGIFPFNRFRIDAVLFLPSSVSDRPDPAVSGGVDFALNVEETATAENNGHLQVDVTMNLASFEFQPSTSALSDSLAICKESPVASTSPGTIFCADNQAIVSPYVVRPLPKAGPRSQSKRGRKQGKTRILTDTPEKLAIDLAEQKKKKKGEPKSKSVAAISKNKTVRTSFLN